MFKKVTNCRCCGHYRLIKYLDLGMQPLANSYHKGEKLPTFPLEVLYCDHCFHNQLSVVVDPDEMFKNYLYVSGTTHTFRDHCRRLAFDAVNYYNDYSHLGLGILMDCWKPPKVLDIACNDGTLLGYFKEIGCNVIKGIDPAANLRKLTEEKGIDVVVDYWRKDIDLGEKFNIITGTNVFAHVDDIQGFLTACVNHLEDWGFIILEFPYCREMIEKREFDTVYHEHLSYFLVSPLVQLIKKYEELRIHDIVLTPIHGGSIRFVLRKRAGEHCDKLYKMMAEEEHLLKSETYEEFSKAVEGQKSSLNRFLETKDTVVGYGASAKGNTMLNHFGVDLKYIVDDNPMKWDYLTPGRDIPIYSPDKLAEEEGPLYVLLLAWNFAEEIKKKVRAIRAGKTTHFVHYVPKLWVDYQIEEIPFSS